MSKYGELQDLLDAVEHEPGWRVEGTKNGYRLYPANHEIPVIHVAYHPERRGLDNLKAQLRNAGFTPFLRKPKRTADVPTAPIQLNGATNGAAPVAPSPPPAPPPRDLIREARCHIQQALEALSSLDSVLGEISGEHEAFAKVKQLFQTMLK